VNRRLLATLAVQKSQANRNGFGTRPMGSCTLAVQKSQANRNILLLLAR